MPQQILVHELKRAIDVARNSNESTATWEMAVGRIMQLCRENPRSTLREHVLHNLGCTRRHWLRQLAAKIGPEILVFEGEYTTASMRTHLKGMSKCKKRDRLPVATATEPAT